MIHILIICSCLAWLTSGAVIPGSTIILHQPPAPFFYHPTLYSSALKYPEPFYVNPSWVPLPWIPAAAKIETFDEDKENATPSAPVEESEGADDGSYKPDNSGDYVPDNSGDYVPDNSGDYVPDNAETTQAPSGEAEERAKEVEMINSPSLYSFEFSTDNQARSESADLMGNVKGRYSYVNGAGNHDLTYLAGAGTGFIPTGGSLAEPNGLLKLVLL